MQAFRDRTVLKLVQLKRKRNATTSGIYTLPSNILVRIFVSLRDESLFQKDFKQLKTLAGVCKQWHSTVLQSPKLWNRITSLYGPNAVKLFLKRSTNTSLTIQLCQSNTRNDECVDFLNTIVATRSRWKIIQWRRDGGYHTPERLAALPSSVKDLDVRTTPRSYWKGLRLDLRNSRAPFDHVTAHGIALPWSSSRLSCLTSLDLAYVDLQLDELQSLLAASPRLKTLSLRNLRQPTTQPQNNRIPPIETPICMLALAKLVIKDAGDQITSSLVRSLHVPNVRQLFIEDIDIPMLEVLSESHYGIFHSVARRMGEAKVINISAWVQAHPKRAWALYGRVTLGSVELERLEQWSSMEGSDGFHIGFSAKPDAMMDRLQQVATFVRSCAPTTRTSLDIGAQVIKKKPRSLLIPTQVLSDLRNTFKLTIGLKVDTVQLFELLSREHDGEKPLPALEVLDLSPRDDDRFIGYLDRSHAEMVLYMHYRGGTLKGSVWRKDGSGS